VIAFEWFADLAPVLRRRSWELVPTSHAEAHGDVATVGATLGFAVMMVLDVALG
jgi:hypothetical protein